MTRVPVELGTTTHAVADNLRRLRRERGLTLRALSEALDVSHPMHRATISAAERGVRGISVDDLTALAHALSVSPVDLLMPDTTTPRFGGDTRVFLSGTPTAQPEDMAHWLRGTTPTLDMTGGSRR